MRPLFLLPECVPYLSLQIDDEQPPTKMKKLAIMEEREDKYEHTLTIRCWLCEPTGGMPIPDALQDSKVHPSPDLLQKLISDHNNRSKPLQVMS